MTPAVYIWHEEEEKEVGSTSRSCSYACDMARHRRIAVVTPTHARRAAFLLVSWRDEPLGRTYHPLGHSQSHIVQLFDSCCDSGSGHSLGSVAVRGRDPARLDLFPGRVLLPYGSLWAGARRAIDSFRRRCCLCCCRCRS